MAIDMAVLAKLFGLLNKVKCGGQRRLLECGTGEAGRWSFEAGNLILHLSLRAGQANSGFGFRPSFGLRTSKTPSSAEMSTLFPRYGKFRKTVTRCAQSGFGAG